MPVILDASARVLRNFADLPFDADTNEDTARKACARAMTALSSDDERYRYDTPGALGADARNALLGMRLLCEDTAAAPYSALFLRDDSAACVQTGLSNHLCVAAYSPLGDVAACLALCQDTAGALEGAGAFARHARYGYLTALMCDVGTGTRMAYLLHLPMHQLVKQIPALSQLANKTGLLLRPASGDVAQNAGALYLLENRVTMGCDAAAQSQALTRWARYIERFETVLCQKVRDRGDEAIFDTPMRAYGIARYARRLTRQDVLSLWSSIALGGSLGLLPELTEPMLRALADVARGPQSAFEKEIDGAGKPANPDVVRAKRVRNIVNGGTL